MANIQVLRLFKKMMTDEFHVALKTSLIHASCVFYCMPITAM